MNQFYTKAIVACFATVVLTVASVSAQRTNHVNAIDCIPEKSIGYVHADIKGLTKFQGLDFFKTLAAGIQPELDELAVEQIGYAASQFKEAAMIFPPLDASQIGSMPADPSKNLLGILTFVDTIDPANAVGTLDGEWKIFNANGRKVFACKERGMCVYHFADNAIIFGNDAWVTWFMQQRAKPASNQAFSTTFALAKQGQISAGINAKSIPKEMRDEIGQGIENLDWAGFTVDLSDGVRVKVASAFDTESAAAASMKQIDSFHKLIAFQLKGAESIAMRQFRTRDKDAPEAAGLALSQLAVARYGLKTLKNIEIIQNENRIDAEMHAKDFDLAATSIVCLAAIQSIGTSANAEFEAIAAELSAK